MYFGYQSDLVVGLCLYPLPEPAFGIFLLRIWWHLANLFGQGPTTWSILHFDLSPFHAPYQLPAGPSNHRLLLRLGLVWWRLVEVLLILPNPHGFDDLLFACRKRLVGERLIQSA
jgi:hypothetical protein